MKKVVGMLACTLCMAFAMMVMFKPLKAEAADRTVTLRYTDAWYIYISDEGYWAEASLSGSTFKDGDILFVDASYATSPVSLELTTFSKFKTVAVNGDKGTVIITNSQSADEVYAANGATLIYNGNAKKVIANPRCVTQISGNVDEIEAVYGNDGANPVFAVSGTVGVYKGKITDGKTTTDSAYNLEAGTVHAYADDKGVVKVAEGTIKSSPDATTPAKENKKELDKVPKTGNGVYTSVLFFSLAAVLAIAGVTIKKRESVK